MRKYKHLKDAILKMSNIVQSELNARRGKKHTYGVKRFDKRKDLTLENIQQLLKDCTYKTSKYRKFKIYEPKERIIYLLPYYPDRIVHHILMSILEPIFVSWFIKNTYSCIKNRGIHKLVSTIEHDLYLNVENTTWCLKLDIRKFYPSINRDKLIEMLSWKIKDKWLMKILSEIIYSTDSGVPIGNYLSLFFANVYLTKIDHNIKECLRVRYYYRYCDDIVIFGNNKTTLYKLYRIIKQKLSFIDLSLKNPRIFPTDFGVDFTGYVFRHTHTQIRKNIKTSFKNKIKSSKNLTIEKFKQLIASYYGWLIHCDGIHLLKTYINDLYYGFHKHCFKHNGLRVHKVGRC